MPVLTKSASKESKKARMHEEMGKYKRGELHSGSKTGPEVTNRAQALAISLHEAGLSKRQSSRKVRGAGGRRSRGR